MSKMEVIAKLRYYRQSPRKVRLIVDLVRGLTTGEAVAQLRHLNKKAAEPLIKLINSGVANARNNFNLAGDNLFISQILVDEGPSLKRWLPRAHGRATQLRKRSAHVKLVLAEIKPSEPEEKPAKKGQGAEEAKLYDKSKVQNPKPKTGSKDKVKV